MENCVLNPQLFTSKTDGNKVTKKTPMKKKIKFLIISYTLILFLGIISCGDDCGPFPDSLKVNSLDWKTYKINHSGVTGTYLELLEINENSVLFNEYSIKITPEKESYFSLRSEFNSFSLINSAYACDPVPPETTNKIENIEISSNIDFNLEYLKNKNLTSLFNIIILDNEKDIYYEKFDLKEYLLSNPKVPTEMILILKEPPLNTSDFEFTIKFNQDGKDNDYFEFTTNPIEIRTE